MKQSGTLKWILAVMGKTKWLIGILVVIQVVLGATNIVVAFIIRQVINMAMERVKKAFWNTILLLAIVYLRGCWRSNADRTWFNRDAGKTHGGAGGDSVVGTPIFLYFGTRWHCDAVFVLWISEGVKIST